jgi:hypothetical protein
LKFVKETSEDAQSSEGWFSTYLLEVAPAAPSARSLSNATNDQKVKGKVDLINASKAASAFTFKGSFLSSNEAAFFRTNRNVHTSTPVRVWISVIEPG